MIIYICVFILSITFTYFAEKSRNKINFILCSFIAILIPSILAGIRDSGIGTDTQVYVDSSWYIIETYANQPITIFIKDILNNNIQLEIAYNLIGYCIAVLGGNIHWFYFILNFIVLLFVYLTINDNKHNASMSLMMFVFLFTFYNISLNLVRQSLALSICSYAYKYIERKQWRNFIIFQVLAILTHNTAFFFILVVPFHFLLESKRTVLNKYFVYAILLITPFAFSLSDIIISYLVLVGFLPIHFLNYTTQNAENMIVRSALVVYLCLWLTMYIGAKYSKISIFNARKYLSFYFFSSELFFSSYFSQFAFRISYYFSYLSNIIFIPRLIRLMISKNRPVGLIFKWVICALIIFYWYWSIVVHNGNETIPYKSKILDSLM